jgi:hypothetical protein
MENLLYQIIETTVGRVLFNTVVPEASGLYQPSIEQESH